MIMIPLEEHSFIRSCSELYRGFLNFFFPPLCLSCDERLLEGEEIFCSRCHSALESVPLPLCPLCGAPVGKRLIEKNRCPDCPQKPVYFDRARAPLLYNGPIVQAVIALKFMHRIELADFFARLLLYYMKMEMEREKVDGIVPVPLHYRRFYSRGFNQSEEIGRILAGWMRVPLWTEVLRRARATKPQTRLAHADRLKNVQDAFVIFHSDPVKEKHVLLLDDVYTTGSTLNACARALKEAGVSKVTALTLCRAI